MVQIPSPAPVDPTLTPDESLLQAIAARQTAALGQLYDRYGRLAFSLAAGILGDSEAAEEVTQDVFLQIWNKAATYDPSQGKVISWLAGIARHRAIDLLRRRSARPEGHAAGWEEDPFAGLPAADHPEAQVEGALQQQRIRQALAALPAEQRQALALAYFKGYSHQQISAELNEPLGTVKTRIRLAMQKLRLLLQDEDPARE